MDFWLQTLVLVVSALALLLSLRRPSRHHEPVPASVPVREGVTPRGPRT